jgi:hypothetical protein
MAKGPITSGVLAMESSRRPARRLSVDSRLAFKHTYGMAINANYPPVVASFPGDETL